MLGRSRKHDLMHLWYSQSMASYARDAGREPYVYYRKLDGVLVRVTLATSTKDASCYAGNDLQYLGQGRYVTTSSAEAELSGQKRKRL